LAHPLESIARDLATKLIEQRGPQLADKGLTVEAGGFGAAQ
jgi:hypothetical protein